MQAPTSTTINPERLSTWLQDQHLGQYYMSEKAADRVGDLASAVDLGVGCTFGIRGAVNGLHKAIAGSGETGIIGATDRVMGAAGGSAAAGAVAASFGMKVAPWMAKGFPVIGWATMAYDAGRLGYEKHDEASAAMSDVSDSLYEQAEAMEGQMTFGTAYEDTLCARRRQRRQQVPGIGTACGRAERNRYLSRPVLHLQGPLRIPRLGLRRGRTGESLNRHRLTHRVHLRPLSMRP